jgi:ATP-binding cassette subfamily G (WHITE) protein 2 (PDR)
LLSSVLLEGESQYIKLGNTSLTLNSGCSTMLKTIAGEMNGIYLEEDSELNYRGITPEQMLSQFRGEAIYTAEVDVHFPKLTVGDTLSYVSLISRLGGGD